MGAYAVVLRRAKAAYELSRCAASADHEFRRGLDSSGMLPATARHLSRIELADLLGLRVARRGFWDAAFSKFPWRENEDNAVGSWERESA